MIEIDLGELNKEFQFYKSYYEGLKSKATVGKWFEDFVPGSVIAHPRSFKVKELGNLLTCMATLNPQPLHMDSIYAKKSYFGKIVPNGLLIAGAVMGYLTVEELTYGTLLASKKFEVDHRRAVFLEDEIVAVTQVLDKANWDKGRLASRVQLRHDVFNQKMERVMIVNREILAYHKPNV